MHKIERGSIVLVDLTGAVGVEKQNDQYIEARPCLVVQNDKGNQWSPMTIVAPITDPEIEKLIPVLVPVTAEELGTGGRDSLIDCGQLRTIDRDLRIKEVLGRLSDDAMERVNKALKISLGPLN